MSVELIKKQNETIEMLKELVAHKDNNSLIEQWNC